MSGKALRDLQRAPLLFYTFRFAALEAPQP